MMSTHLMQTKIVFEFILFYELGNVPSDLTGQPQLLSGNYFKEDFMTIQLSQHYKVGKRAIWFLRCT